MFSIKLYDLREHSSWNICSANQCWLTKRWDTRLYTDFKVGGADANAPVINRTIVSWMFYIRAHPIWRSMYFISLSLNPNSQCQNVNFQLTHRPPADGFTEIEVYFFIIYFHHCKNELVDIPSLMYFVRDINSWWIANQASDLLGKLRIWDT